MKRIGWFLAAMALSSGFSLQAAEPEQIGDWGLVCTDAAEGVQQTCNIFQTALISQPNAQQPDAEPTTQRILLTRIGYLGDAKTPSLLITVPLGALIPTGVQVELEGHEKVTVPMLRCDGGGCLAQGVMPESLVAAFKKGTAAKVTFFDPAQRGIGVPLSLKGITKALAALDEKRKK